MIAVDLHYQAAVDALPPLSRAVFLLHRIGGFSETEIASSIAVPSQSVRDCMAEALCMIWASLEGENPAQYRRVRAVEAEHVSRTAYRKWLIGRAEALGLRSTTIWNDPIDAKARSKPSVRNWARISLEAVFLGQVDGLCCREVMRRLHTFRWIKRRAKVEINLPMPPISDIIFEHWVVAQVRDFTRQLRVEQARSPANNVRARASGLK